MNTLLIRLLASCVVITSFTGGAQILRLKDDSYTVSERFYRYKEQYPELEWPALTFDSSQKLLFDRRYREVDGVELHIDAFLPGNSAQNPATAIMLVHGGGWRSGSKSHFYAMANLLVQKGYAVFMPEYRLSDEAKYPHGMIDLNHALVWIRANAKQFNIDANRIAIGGGSSGGHMAALLGNTANKNWYRQGIENHDSRVFAIVDLDGVLDFTTPLGLSYENKKGDSSAAGLWFGGSYEKAKDKWHQASTAKHIHPGSPPLLVISSGQLRFTTGKEETFEKLSAYNIDHEYYQFDNIIHTFWLFQPYLSTTVEKVDKFLQKQVSISND